MEIKSIEIIANEPTQLTGEQAPMKDDIAWFNAQMDQPKADPAQEDNVASRIIGGLSQHNSEIQKLSDRAGRDLQKAARTAAPEDMLKANRSMSNFYLESLMTAKMVSKGSQAVEKLTNLQ